MWYQSQRTKPELSEPTTEEWPPSFQTYEHFSEELHTAIREHPPFGVWLKNYRNLNHLVRDGKEMWGEKMDVQALKKRYIQEQQREQSSRNSKRFFSELHLDALAEDIQYCEKEFNTHKDMYNAICTEQEQKRRCGYATHCQRVPLPRKSELLVISEYLRQCNQETSLDIPHPSYADFKRLQEQKQAFVIVPWHGEPPKRVWTESAQP